VKALNLEIVKASYIMKSKITLLFFALAFVVAGFSAAFGQRIENVKFKAGATSGEASGSVSAAGSKTYRINVLRGSVLFLQTRGNVSYKVYAAGCWFDGATGAFDAEWISSNYGLQGQTKFLIKVFSDSGKTEKFTLYAGASALK
jgi:hypothetical protein